MNIEMLQFLAKLSNYERKCIDVNKFFEKYDYSEKTINDLNYLDANKYITVLRGKGKITEIGVSRSATDFLQKNQLL